MSARGSASTVPNKETIKAQATEAKVAMNSNQAASSVKIAGAASKPLTKPVKEVMSPTPAEPDRPELLGSLTTEQQQRTSARVIKKLRLEPPGEKRGKTDGADELNECETPSKTEDTALKFPTVKQRMPKALWSADEKSLFFEALNEWGKDFDAITAHIRAKMKKKGMPDKNLKTKTQVSHFYYRTWHKLSKHLRFDDNVKKVAQELYALINYGELRKKLVSVNEKTCARLGEMVLGGSIVVRARGRNVRVRTPMCRALRKLNQITAARGVGAGGWAREAVWLRARDAAAWSRVLSAAHNPRARALVPPRVRLKDFVTALQARWAGSTVKKRQNSDSQYEEGQKETEDTSPDSAIRQNGTEDYECDDHLNLETDRMILEDQKLVLHVGPKPNAEIHLPVISACEQLSSQKICFSSYLERISSQRSDKDGVSKIRTPKRQRKDSATEKDKEVEQKKMKTDEVEPSKMMHIDETAVDGIELMANYKNLHDDEEKPSTEDEKEVKVEDKPSTEDEKELKADETAEEDLERDKDMFERENYSFSEMEDDEKFIKSDTDNESDNGKSEKSTQERKFRNLKVKFRIRPKKRGGTIYTLVLDKEREKEMKCEKNDEPSKVEEGSRETKPAEEEVKPAFDVALATQQIRNGWSACDAGELTIGDLYLMFGSRSKLELDYWWAEPSPPLQQSPHDGKKEPEKISPPDKDRAIDKREKIDKTPDKEDSSAEDADKVSDTDIFSPKHTYSQDSNDGLSGDERKGEQQSSPEHKPSSSTFQLVSKLLNRPTREKHNHFAQISDRLKRLLSLCGNTAPAPSPAAARCSCGHVCARAQKPKPQYPCEYSGGSAPLFRQPVPIAPHPAQEKSKPLSLSGVPRWRRGAARGAGGARGAGRVVVQRLLPLLPKLPPGNDLIPVQIVPNSNPAAPKPLPKILPKPPPVPSSDLTCFYVLSESNGQFFFHDGDKRIPITSEVLLEDDDELPDNEVETKEDGSEVKSEMKSELDSIKGEETPAETSSANGTTQLDMDMYCGADSSLTAVSPSRLLRDAEWGCEHDYSLSSLLGTLESRAHSVDSQLQSLMAESSVDYVAKFADLAADITDDPDLPPHLE